VRELLEYWGEEARNSRATDKVEAVLSNHGLVSSPDFRKVTLDSRVKLELERDVEESEVKVEFGSGRVAPPDSGRSDETPELDVGRTVGNLASALGGVVSVSPNSTFEEAITKMLLNDYSQLAVMQGSRSLVGAVTWKSIAQARHANGRAPFRQAIIQAREVRFDQELVDVLSDLVAHDFLFVRNQANEIAGIVTTADVVLEYGELATPFLLIGELDRLLRRLISQTFQVSEVQAACPPDGQRSVESFDQMSFGDYQRVLQNPANWQRLGWPLDRRVFDERLSELREVRNDVMHFNPDPVPSDAIAKLRAAIRLMRQYGE
jgi:CBS domain-containing protein